MRITLVRSILRIKQTCNQYHSFFFLKSSCTSLLLHLVYSPPPHPTFPLVLSTAPSLYPCPLHCPLTLPLSTPLPPHFLHCPLPSALTFSLVLSPPPSLSLLSSPLSPHFTPCPLPSPLPPLLSPFSFPSFLTSFLTFTLSLFRVLSEQN